ncbi:MAG TPA: AsmA family protein [Caldimonas sp.]|nr:AsmA family protein [Caldimonas sp.]
MTRRLFSDHRTDAAPTRRRWWRIVAIALAGIVLLLGVIYAAIVIAFPPERLALLLAKKVKAATGREFRIDGGLSIRVLPTIAIEAREIALGNAAWGSRAEMVTVRRAAIRVSPRALLEGELDILRVEVEGVDALLESDGAGRHNWEFTRTASADAATKAAPRDARTTDVALKRVVASDVRVAYREGSESPAQTLTIETLDLRSNDSGNEVDVALVVGKQRWKVDGQVGPGAILFAGQEDWPFDVRLSGDGAKVSAKGALGTGERTGRVVADVSSDFATAAVLAALGDDAARLPMPASLSARVQYAGRALRADPLHVSIAGQTVDGRLTLNTAPPRPRIDATLTSASIDVTKLAPASTSASGVPESAAGHARGPRFADTPLPFATVPGVDLDIDFRTESLRLPHVPPLSSVRGRLTSTPDRLALDNVEFAVAGGRVRSRSTVVLAAGAPPRVDLFLDAKSLSVEALDVALGGGGHFRGGRVNLFANLVLAGTTPRQLVASASGNVLMAASDATLAGSAGSALDRNILMSMLGLLIPKGSADRALAVQCVVVHLPLRRGIATVDRSIAAETREVAVVASGTIDLVDQTLRLELRPSVKKGLGLNPANLATDFMEISGPLQNPQMGVGAKGAVRGATKVGVGVATGGLSFLVPSVVGGANKDVSACAQAAARAPAQPTPHDRSKAGE